MIYDLQRASLWKRISAFLFDAILLGIAAVLFAWCLSAALGYDGYSDTLITKTEELDAYLKQISKRADIVRSGGVKRTEDNMLKITTDGRKPP